MSAAKQVGKCESSTDHLRPILGDNLWCCTEMKMSENSPLNHRAMWRYLTRNLICYLQNNCRNLPMKKGLEGDRTETSAQVGAGL